MVRVAGTDPGTTSLDVLILDHGLVADQARFTPEQLRAEPKAPVAWLLQRGPLDLVAGPSGYGLPLVAGRDCTEADLARMSLVRPDETRKDQGVAKFSALLRAFSQSTLPVVFLPGVIYLPTVSSHRKLNRIDLGTADKVSVAALALAQEALHGHPIDGVSCCLVELGSVFTACLVIRAGQIVDGAGGTSGPVGWGSAGAWDGEVAYWLSPLGKGDLFAGGASFCPDRTTAVAWFVEALLKCVGGLLAVHAFAKIVLSGRLLETEPEVVDRVGQELSRVATVDRLASLPGAWVKHAAQGAAILADGLAGGTFASVADHLALRQASGSVLDWICHPAIQRIR
jgi:predicted butyrate kinase (DUF1464 family)